MSTSELKPIMEKIEKEAEQNVVQLKTEQKVSLQNLNTIMENGAEEFKKTVGRPMTYSEMRALFG